MKKFLILTLCACLCAGCTSRDEGPAASISQQTGDEVSDREFESYLDEFVVNYCQQNIMLAQRFFEHPEDYGIDLNKCQVTLGTFLPDEEEIRFTEDVLNQLSSWNPDRLSRTNRQIYEQMRWEYELAARGAAEKYAYLDNIWSGSSGVFSTLTTAFSEYQLYSEDDIDILVELIEDVPRYADLAIEYTDEQVRRGLFEIDYDSAIDTVGGLLETKEDSPIESELNEEVDRLQLSRETNEEAKKRIHQALEKNLFPSFEKMKKALEEHEDDNQPMEGLARKEDGKEYYEILVENYGGTSESIDTIQNELEDAADGVLERYSEIMSENPKAISEMMDLKTSFKSVSEIMPFLEERYPAQFPMVTPVEYEIKPLSDEQSTEGTMAYFVNQPIDADRPYEIRYNRRDYGEDASSLELYNTFAHEGIPGHMYQAQYMKDHFTSPVQYMLSSFGMQEGYASYAAYQTVAWTGLNEDALEVWKLNELYSNYCILMMDLQVNWQGATREEFAKQWGDENASLYDRLCEEPGLFFGYYYGCHKLEALQQIAREALGDLYDPVRFNNAILQAGNVHFGIVEENVQHYIETTRKGGEEDEKDSSQDEKNSGKTSSSSQKDSSDDPFEPVD